MRTTAQEEPVEQEPRIWLRSLEGLEVEEGEASVPADNKFELPVTESDQEPLDVAGDVDEEREERNKKGRSLEFSFGENFVVDSMDVPTAKIIPQVIRDIALDLFPDNQRYRGNDYYYAYTYSGTRLVFAILKSKSYLTGKVPGFLPAMVSPGRYAYRQGSQYYLLEHEEDGSVTTKVCQEPQPDCIDLEAAAGTADVQKVEPTLYLQWSLSHNYRPVTLVMLMVFIALLAGYGLAMRGYRDISAKTARLSGALPLAAPTTGLPPVGAYIKTVADSTSSQGAVIKQIKKIDKTNLIFAVEFETENDTRDFISRKGGRYEDGKVVFAFDLAGTR